MALIKRASTNKSVPNSPGLLVLQWLTYAFWGWTALALIWLTSQSVSFFLDSETSRGYENDTVAYSLAAVIVLFIISLICDALYSKREPLHKQGAAMVIMIIHAVIFALFAIGSLIAAVFAVVNLLIGSGTNGNEGPLTVLITGLIMTVVYGATLLRTLRPFKLKRVTLVYGLFMALVSVGVIALGVMGPALYAAETKDDRLIEQGLPQVSEGIRAYTEENDKLPENLSVIQSNLSNDGKILVERNLVEYQPGKKNPMTRPTNSLNEPDSERLIDPAIAPVPSDTSYSYTLCVTYKGKKGTNGPTPMLYKVDNVSPDTYQHAAGRVCYNLQTAYTRYY